MKKILVGVGATMLVLVACAWDFSEKANPSQVLGFGARVERNATNSIAISSCEGQAVVTAINAAQIGTGSNGVVGTIKYRSSYLVTTPIPGSIPAANVFGNLPTACMTQNINAAEAAVGVDAAVLRGNIASARMTNGVAAALNAAGQDIDAGANVSAWNQYCVIGPDQSVMLRIEPLTGLTNAQVVVFSPVFHVAPIVLLTYSATAGYVVSNSPYAASVTTNGFTVAGAATGVTLSGLAIGGH